MTVAEHNGHDIETPQRARIYVPQGIDPQAIQRKIIEHRMQQQQQSLQQLLTEKQQLEQALHDKTAAIAATQGAITMCAILLQGAPDQSMVEPG